MIKILALLLVFSGMVITLRILMPSFSKSVAGGIVTINGESQLAECPGTPNCQCSESTRSEHSVDRLELTLPADNAIATLAGIVGTFEGTAIVSQTDRYLHATFTTRWMGFVDDVEFLISDDRQSIQLRSASRLGKSDLGTNATRVDNLRKASAGKL